MANPFYVEPANIQPALDNAMQGFRSYAVDTKTESDKADRANELGTLINEGTAADLGDYLLRYPELGKNVDIAMGAKKTLTDEEDNSWAWGILTGQADPQKAALQRAELIQSRGGDSALTIQITKDAMAGNFEPAKKMSVAILAKNQPKELKEYLEATGQNKGKTTDLSSFVELERRKWLDANPGKTEVPPQVLQDAALNFKRQQATEAASVATAKTDATLKSELEMKPQVTAAVEGARLNTKIALEPTLEALNAAARMGVEAKMKPRIEGAVRLAVSQVEEGVKRAGQQFDANKTFGTYEEAMNGLAESLTGTATNPVAGWLPAVTAKAQVAEGALASMAPILKALFRASGEGTFSDKDQELLISMLPTRKVHPEAAKVIMQNIDSIVRSKLGQPQVDYGTKPPRKTTALPAGITEEDIQYTMKKRGLTRDQVIKKLGGR